MTGMVYAVIVGIGIVLAAIWKAFNAGGKGALAKRDAAEGKANAKLQKEFDKIDSGKPDVDAAIDRLSKRAGRDNRA